MNTLRIETNTNNDLVITLPQEHLALLATRLIRDRDYERDGVKLVDTVDLAGWLVAIFNDEDEDGWTPVYDLINNAIEQAIGNRAEAFSYDV